MSVARIGSERWGSQSARSRVRGGAAWALLVASLAACGAQVDDSGPDAEAPANRGGGAATASSGTGGSGAGPAAGGGGGTTGQGGAVTCTDVCDHILSRCSGVFSNSSCVAACEAYAPTSGACAQANQTFLKCMLGVRVICAGTSITTMGCDDEKTQRDQCSSQ